MIRIRGLQHKDGKRNIISQRLSQARHDHQPPITQEQLSQILEETESMSMSVGTIGKIEAGLRGVSDYEVAAFARIFNVSSDWLLGLESKT
jgi:hypothetical protein